MEAIPWSMLQLQTKMLSLYSTVDMLSITAALLALAIAVTSVYLRQRLLTGRKASSPESVITAPTFDPNKDREDGEWTPVDFTYPPITPCPLELSEIKPIAYRPFRPGEYHVTMGIRNMVWDEWIELDDEYEMFQRLRAHRIEIRGKDIIRVLPETPNLVRSGDDASIELLHELVEYLPRRYPKVFEVIRYPRDTVTPHSGWDGLPQIKTIKVLPLGTSYDIPRDIYDGENAAVKALEIASLLIQEDLALMIEGQDGQYYFQAGAILIPGTWRIQDKIGMPLEQIHITGNVPRYKEKLHTGMARFFKRMPVDKPVARNNYLFQPVPLKDDVDPNELGWAESIHGPEATFPNTRKKAMENPTPTPSSIFLRVERQTLRRLPRSGAVVFTIRTYQTSVEKLGREPGVVRRLASALRGWGDDVGEYKAKWRGGWWDVLLDYLDNSHADMVKKGIEVPESAEKYPF
ncbi:hypothetical protein Hypma_012433 [Hypsizygus marmoreus]|uniref:Uncharacterized protein n=1 Tax=Hypsizygus marmoreus TaxID=39966 RepID=A0A369JGR3_HYPMA|nr:hypothetical protein Hypma_012433 [Hypsizygus marmoreus]